MNSLIASLTQFVTQFQFGNARLLRRLQAVEGFDSEDQEAVIRLIDGMIAKQQMQTTLTSLDDQAVNA